ncbi:TlpA family protein disulfide reductase [Candidatus Bipolaricaulota bacterium]|nr:TlpA family protein disulfide reductase [Candidatus Bipolaricaulota bacterium]
MMMKNLHSTALAVLVTTALALSLVFAVGCSESAPEGYTVEELGLQGVSVEAPDFTLDTMGGTQISLSSLRGTPVFINFWQLSCPPCKEEMPFLEAAAREYEGRAYILAIDLGDSEASVQDYFGSDQLAMIIPLDTVGRAAGAYSVGFTPTTFLVDAEGIVRYVKVGPFTSEAQVLAAMELIVPGG